MIFLLPFLYHQVMADGNGTRKVNGRNSQSGRQAREYLDRPTDDHRGIGGADNKHADGQMDG
jgi:hypothetical protein